MQEQDNLGVPTIKYGETIVFIRHIDSDLWISYETLELTIKGIGKVEEKRVKEQPPVGVCRQMVVILRWLDYPRCWRSYGRLFSSGTSSRTRTENCLSHSNLQCHSRSIQSNWVKTKRSVWSATYSVRSRFSPMSMDAEAANHLLSKSDVVQALLQDLIGFFSQPSLTLDHEERQLRLKALRNRQDLFQEEVGAVLSREISARLDNLLREWFESWLLRSTFSVNVVISHCCWKAWKRRSKISPINSTSSWLP